MSQQLIDRNPDLKKLRDEGIDVQIKNGYLYNGMIPYLNANKEVKYGTLISTLTFAGEKTAKPEDHVAHFIGEYPCNIDGSQIATIRYPHGVVPLGGGVGNNFSFSSKPPGVGYTDYYHKMTTYIKAISGPANALTGAKPQTFPSLPVSEEESVFNYFDSASSRAGIGDLSEKLKVAKIAIVGLGGTGSYVLDFVAKTPAKEIHIYDKDVLLNHNAFRTPGAASLEQLDLRPKKVAYLAEAYGKMRRKIFPHDCEINEETVTLLQDSSFVFLCIDGGPLKKMIAEQLEKWELPFVDVGMGLQHINGAIRGILATTTSTSKNRECARKRMCVADTEDGRIYSQNIQVAELNALNAAFAVLKWKKLLGFYHDTKQEHFSAYTIGGNMLTNEGSQ